MPVVVCDPYYDEVVALLHFNGTNGQRTTTDEKGHTVNIVFASTTELSNVQVKYGPTAVRFPDGAAQGVEILTGGDSDFNFGTGDFTIEHWVYIETQVPTNGKFFFIWYDPDTNSQPIRMTWDHIDNHLNFNLFGIINTPILGLTTAAGAVPFDGYHHIAVTRDSGMVRLFVDGILLASGMGAATLNGIGTNGRVWVGSNVNGSGSIADKSYFDDFRITKGVARYIADFTPPAAQFPDVQCGPTTTVPDVVGLTEAAADSAILAATLVTGTVTEEYSETVPVGLVISQNPNAGDTVGESTAVDYVVSLGPEPATVPDIFGLTEAAANSAITSASLVVGTVTSAYSSTVAAGLVKSQSPAAGATVLVGSAVDYVLSLGPAPTTIVPDVVGLSVSAARVLLEAALLTMGSQTSVYNATVPVGTIFQQAPTPGLTVLIGTGVDVRVSLGVAPITVPFLVGLTAAAASIALTNAGLRTGDISYVSDSEAVIGNVVGQEIAGGTVVAGGSRVGFVINAFITPFDYQRTVISQYANSPTLLALVDDLDGCIDPRTNMEAFYAYVWNVDSARGFGLDIWGRIVGVSRLLKIPNSEALLGFHNSSIPDDWVPFNQGVFFTGTGSSQAYLLPDDIYRTLILTKALANIVATNASSLNQLLRNLFPGRGRAFVRDNGGMSMTFVFEFDLTAAEYAILTQSGALPHPAGVEYNVIVVSTGLTFGFSEQGPPAQPFDSGIFYVPAG